jgi:hypothetical protein
MRKGAAMMRFGPNLYQTAALSGVTMVTLLLLGAIVVRSVAPAENGGQVTLDIGVTDLRGSLP